MLNKPALDLYIKLISLIYHFSSSTALLKKRIYFYSPLSWLCCSPALEKSSSRPLLVWNVILLPNPQPPNTPLQPPKVVGRRDGWQFRLLRFNSETFSTALLLSTDERPLEIIVILNSGYYMAAPRIAECYNNFRLEKGNFRYRQVAI